MLRDIIEIDEELCDGCGDCTTGCSEGALKIVDGKAKLVREDFCDGFGDCVAVCPTGALKVTKRDVPDFDMNATKQHVYSLGGEEAVQKLDDAHKRHIVQQLPQNHSMQHHGGGCPGSAARELRRDRPAQPAVAALAPVIIPSELEQWPVQLHLVNPAAPYLKNKELVVMSTCGPIASAEVHQRYLRGRSVVVACPKLDNTAPYSAKLAMMFREAHLPKVIVVIMQVPCCKGLTHIVQDAADMSGVKDLVIEEHTLSLTGELLNVSTLETAKTE